MKKTIFIIIVILSVSSCSNDFLNLEPISEMSTDGFYKTEDDINQAVMSAYAGLRAPSERGAIYIGEVRSDNTTFSWVPGDSQHMVSIDNFNDVLLADNNNVLPFWNNVYTVIMRCNVVLDHIDDVEFTNQDMRNQYIGEAKFVRALMYFWLVQTFGGVPKVEAEITVEEAYKLGRSSVDEIYDLIVNDLKDAETNLPDSYNVDDIGRVTNGGAKGLLAKVYITMAGYPLEKGVEYYALAETKAYEVIQMPQYSLVADYNSLWDLSDENSTESLFEIQYKKGGTSTGSTWSNDFAPRFSDKEVVLVGDKSGFNAPTIDMSNAYEAGDPRKFISMRDYYISDATGEQMNVKYVMKYNDISFGGSDNDNNWIELRLADIYLLYAEALVREGKNPDDALLYLNKIRERARNSTGGNGDVLPDYKDFNSTEDFLLAIEHERRVELAFENHRWFDLVRTKRAQTVMSHEQEIENGFNPSSWNDNMLLFPIPQQVILSNPELITQNPGY